MGYTHYWRNIPRGDIPAEALKLVRKVLKRHASVVQREYDDARRPVVRKDLIRFNGIDEDGHETFYFKPGEGFSFCKTACKPYDQAVCEALLILKVFMPSMKLSSDGFDHGLIEEYQTGVHDETWPAAIEAVRGLGVQLPDVTEAWCESQ